MKPQLIMAILLFAGDAMAAPLTLRDYLALSGPPPTARFAYGRAPSQYVELFEPAGEGPFPVVVLVHGGCWIKEFAGIAQMRNMAGALAAQGIAVWNVEYRRVDEPGGGYPGTFLDMAAAVTLLTAQAGANHLDLSRVVAVGHSAGGHLVQWLAGRSRIEKSSALHEESPFLIRHIVALGSIGDLRHRIDGAGKVCGVPMPDLIGHPSPQRPDPYSDTSPAELMPTGGHTILINGELDTISPPLTATEYAARAATVRELVDTITLPGASHYDEVAVASPAWPAILSAIRTALGMSGP